MKALIFHRKFWFLASRCQEGGKIIAPCSVVWSAGIGKKWHHLVVQRGATGSTTWCHVALLGGTVAPPWCYCGATFAQIVQSSVQRWHHSGAMVVPHSTTLHYQVMPLFFYACRPYNRVQTGWCHQILVLCVEQTRLWGDIGSTLFHIHDKCFTPLR